MRRTIRYLTLLFMLTAICRTPAYAQQNNAQIRLSANEQERLVQNLRQGEYDDVIDQTTTLMMKAGHQDEVLSYYRGMAEWAIGWFGDSWRDFTFVKNAHSLMSGQAESYLARIEALQAVCPPKTYEVKNGDTVVFRVYYSLDDQWTASIIKLLPSAFNAVQNLLGTTVTEVPVFIFDSPEKYGQFEQILSGQRPHSWSWASASRCLLKLCPIDQAGHYISPEYDSDYFRSSVAHEYLHCVLDRKMGSVTVPIWFNEGLAQVAGAGVAPGMNEQNDLQMARLYAAGTLLDLGTLNNRNRFYGNSEEQLRGGTQDPYCQAMSMVRFLLSKMKNADDLQTFLNTFHSKGDFDAALVECFGGNQDDLFKAWLANLAATQGGAMRSSVR